MEEFIIITTNVTTMQSQYEDNHERIRRYIRENGIKAEFLEFPDGVHTVEDAVREAKISAKDIAKSIVLIDSLDRTIVGIVRGSDRVSTKRIGKILGIEAPRVATPEEVLGRIGYPVGGVPCFSYEATYVIDPSVLEKDVVYSSGGSPYALIRIASQEIMRMNTPTVGRIRK